MSIASLDDFLASINRYSAKAQESSGKGGFFDQAGGGFTPAVTPEQLLEFQRLQSYIANPDQVEGAAGSGGHMLGQAIAQLVNSRSAKNSPQTAPQPKIDPQAVVYKRAAELLRNTPGMDVGEAFHIAGTEALSSGNESLAAAGNQAVDLAISKYKYNPELGANSKTDIPLTPAQARQFGLVNDPTGQTQWFVTTTPTGERTFKQDKVGPTVQLTGEYPGSKTELAKQIDAFRTSAINTTESIADIDQLKGSINSIPEGTGYTGKYVGIVNNIVSTVSGLASAAFKDPDTAKDFAKYVGAKLPSNFEQTAISAGVNQSIYNKLSYMIARSNNTGAEASGGRGVSDNDFKSAQQQTGMMLSDPKVASAILDQIRTGMIRKIHTTAEYSKDILDNPAAKQIYDTFSAKYPSGGTPASPSEDGWSITPAPTP